MTNFPPNGGSAGPSRENGSTTSPAEMRFAQRGRFQDWVIAGNEVTHPNSTALPQWLSGRCTTKLCDITHIETSRRGFRLGTRQNAHSFSRKHFVQEEDCEHLLRSLEEAIAELPGGSQQLQRMGELTRKASEYRRCWVSLGVTLSCAVAFLLQMLNHPDVLFAGDFKPDLIRLGEYWRAITANLLHSSFGHFLLNILGLRILGSLVERPLGGQATFLVLVASGLGAMGASFIADYFSVVGASGMVFGLAGAVLCLEIQQPDALPVSWRLPRRILIAVIAAEILLMTAVPVIAGAAHAGGLVAGYLTARLVSRGGLGDKPAWLEKATAPFAAVCILAVGAAFWSELSPGAAVERAERLLAVQGIEPAHLNNVAWQIAVSETPTGDELSVAQRLAEQAVNATDRGDPHLLDTLAEVHFAAGRSERALAVIEEAIALAPGESYYREQRRRFQGLRKRGDRPADPSPL
jgi:membrane associated rhomboid family serine protease